ncbi:MAG: hypothetical protein JSS94_08400 [Bacteroidetes bacterium]|nr:hypothetical protein [Bacteroidota bacterium]
MKVGFKHIISNFRIIFQLSLVFFIAFTFFNQKAKNATVDSLTTAISIKDCLTIDPSVTEECNENALLHTGRTLKVVKKIVSLDKIFIKVFAITEFKPGVFFDFSSVSLCSGIRTYLYLFHLF